MTMTELARMAGVSRATVDRVLNGRGQVHPDTEVRIRQLAEAMGYRPNIAAKSLATRKRQPKIGCIFNRMGNSFFDDVIQGARSAAAEFETFGVSVDIRQTRGLEPQEQLSLIEQMAADGIHALALTPINHPDIVDALNRLARQGIPIVSVTTDAEGIHHLAYVGCDHEKSGRIAGNLALLFNGGQANSAVVIGSHRMQGHALRVKGFKDAEARYPGLTLACILETGDDDITTYKEVKRLLTSQPDINSIFFAAAGARGGIRAVEELGLAGSVTIIAFDLTESKRDALERGVASAVLCQEPFRQGYTAVKLLANRLISGESPRSDKCYMKTEIVIRESVEDADGNEGMAVAVE
ncbi:LacI family DNA-binding transcriptional regulator [Ruminococcaceae bacterium OttesenSCG-928-L11]|nr:LacI family DNA-binding transcriptional regulator [Ruminococcaceae bacterium OttesenSCG-928-L11]